MMVIVCQSGMSHSTTATIFTNKKKVMEAVIGSASLKETRLKEVEEEPISDVEKLLRTWIEDQTQKPVRSRTMVIMAKAKSLFAVLKQKT